MNQVDHDKIAHFIILRRDEEISEYCYGFFIFIILQYFNPIKQDTGNRFELNTSPTPITPCFLLALNSAQRSLDTDFKRILVLFPFYPPYSDPPRA